MGFEPSVTLNTGAKMPLIGYGTWQAVDNDLENGLQSALEAGYRHIDTAGAYDNEDIIGRVLSEWLKSGKLKREEIFITTKLPPRGNRPESVEKYLKLSLEKLQLDYVDMYLIHVPFGMKESENPEFDMSTDLVAIWKEMEKHKESGKAKAIGISNFNAEQINRIIQNSKIPPANLQIELHVLMQQKPLVQLCKEKNIVVTAYSPLGTVGTFGPSGFLTRNVPILFDLDVVKALSKKYNKTAAQILLKFILQQNIVVIPKSLSSAHIKENISITDFKLNPEDVEALEGLDQGEKGRILIFTDFFKGVEEHPEFPFKTD